MRLAFRGCWKGRPLLSPLKTYLMVPLLSKCFPNLVVLPNPNPNPNPNLICNPQSAFQRGPTPALLQEPGLNTRGFYATSSPTKGSSGTSHKDVPLVVRHTFYVRSNCCLQTEVCVVYKPSKCFQAAARTPKPCACYPLCPPLPLWPLARQTTKCGLYKSSNAPVKQGSKCRQAEAHQKTWFEVPAAPFSTIKHGSRLQDPQAFRGKVPETRV